MNLVEWINQEVDIIKKEREKKRRNSKEPNDGLDGYMDMCIDAAKELALKISEQGHSGMSVQVTLAYFKNLATYTPLSPIKDELWGDAPNVCGDKDGDIFTWQNKRLFSLFRYGETKEGPYTYSYNEILDIVNNDAVWRSYPPLNDPGTLNDEHPDVALYFSKRRELQEKLNSKIAFPFSPKTYYYKWNFATKDFDEVDENVKK